MITCKEAVNRLWDYLDRNLGRLDEAEVDAHLGTCRHCCGELEFSRRIRDRLRQSHGPVELPPEVQARLETLLRNLEERP